MSGTLRRVTYLATLCALIVTASWLLFPSESHHADRADRAASGTAAGDRAPDDRSDRSSRDGRPSPGDAHSPSDSLTRPSREAALAATVIDLVNTERARAGCDPLRSQTRLHIAAQRHSDDMAENDELSHTGSDGSDYSDRADGAGYHAVTSENIAMGYDTPEAVVTAWMKSDGHQENILNCDAKASGVGIARTQDGTPYWTQMFGWK
ncbi:MAG: CAP domain-containing protein [Micromonosporaceae bacterium]